MDITIVLQTMIQLFLILCIGYILNKTGVFDEHINKSMSSLIVNLTSPMLVIASMATIDGSQRTAVLSLLGIGFLMYLVFIVLGKLFSRIPLFPKHDRPVYELMVILANTGFMGYPVLQSVLGEGAVFYGAMLHMAFNFIALTYGIICINANQKETASFDLKQLISPGFVLLVIAILIYLLQIPLPSFVISTASMVGAITSPLSMMIIGSSLAMYSLKDSLSDWRSYFFAAIRLLVMPTLTWAVTTALHVDPFYAAIAIITNGMPVASMVLMLATRYNANQQIATRNIVVSTLLSILTIPLIVSLFVSL